MDEELKEYLRNLVDESLQIYAELEGESDRATAILAAANFEDYLRDSIESKFVNLNSDIRNDIFYGYGPLSTFKAKIDIGCALDLFDRRTRKHLHRIRRIRNSFAHSPKPVKFDHDEIASKCQALEIDDDYESNTPRHRYLSYLEQVQNLIATNCQPKL